MEKTKEEIIMEETKMFAETNGIYWDNTIASMVLNAYREGEDYRKKTEESINIKTQEEIIEQAIKEIKGLGNVRLILHSIYYEAFKQGKKAGFESCREKVEEGVKKQIKVDKKSDVQQTIDDNYIYNDAIDEVLATIKDIKE